eukprot:403347283
MFSKATTLLISFTVALFLGKVSLLECQAGDNKFCSDILGAYSLCLPTQDNSTFECQLDERMMGGDQEDYTNHNAVSSRILEQKFKLKGYITPETYNDCFCNYCPKNSNSLGLCETQGAYKKCALVEGQLAGKEDSQVWKACMTDQELADMKKNLQNNQYTKIDSQRYVIEDTTLAKKPYSCLTQQKFYVTSSKKCNTVRFGMKDEISFDDMTFPLSVPKDANCNGFTIKKGTQLEKFQSKIGTEQACLVGLKTDGSQNGKSTYKVYARTSSMINAYVRDSGVWRMMQLDEEFSVVAGSSQDWPVMIVNTDPAGSQLIEFQAQNSMAMKMSMGISAFFALFAVMMVL